MIVMEPGLKTSKNLRAALSVAATSRCNNQHGAVVVRRGKIVSTAINIRQHSAHERSWRNSHIHAEAAAVRAAGAASFGSTVYVARVDAAGDAALSAPCLRCQGAMLRAGVRRVVYTH